MKTPRCRWWKTTDGKKLNWYQLKMAFCPLVWLSRSFNLWQIGHDLIVIMRSPSILFGIIRKVITSLQEAPENFKEARRSGDCTAMAVWRAWFYWPLKALDLGWRYRVQFGDYLFSLASQWSSYVYWRYERKR